MTHDQVTDWHREVAEGIAKAHPLPPVLPEFPQPGPGKSMYRVEADWLGGGFGYTLPFADAESAARWAMQRSRFHKGAHITITARSANDEPDSTSQPGERA